MSHQYILTEILSLSTEQTVTLEKSLLGLANVGGEPMPACRLHWAVRPDGKAVLWEAAFDDNEVSPDYFDGYAANALKQSPFEITRLTASTADGPTATWRVSLIPRMRVTWLGGESADWKTSQAAALAYLKANREAWTLPDKEV